MIAIFTAKPIIRFMDDEEYYRKMREQYSHKIQVPSKNRQTYRQWATQQGKDDAEMLMEKNDVSEMNVFKEESDEEEQ